MRHVIIRDDDTSAVTPVSCLERLYRPFLDRGLAVNLATIPAVRTNVRIPDGRLEGFLTAGGIGELRPGLRPLAGNPELVDYLKTERGYHLVQHGCHHDYLEFGATDSADLRRRIDQGRECLAEAGFAPPSTFVAPYDRISPQAYGELTRRFRVVSTGWFELRRLPRAWWPAYAAKKIRKRPHWRAGRAALLSHPGCILSYHRPYEGMLAAVQRAVEQRGLTVLVTHWWEYFRDGQADERFVDVLHSVADWLASRPDIQVVPFSAVANGEIALA